MGKLRNYFIGALAAGAIAVGAYSLLREPSKPVEFSTNRGYNFIKEQKNINLDVGPISAPIKKEKVVENSDNEQIASQRKMPGFLEEILERPCFNEDYIDTFSTQLERLLVLCPQWRKKEYVTKNTNSISTVGTSVDVEYDFRGMNITEQQFLTEKTGQILGRGTLKNNDFELSHSIQFRIKKDSGSTHYLEYTILAEGVDIISSSLLDKNSLRTFIKISTTDLDGADLRNTYPVDKFLVESPAIEYGSEKADPEPLLGDKPSENKKHLRDEDLKHNSYERVSASLVGDLQNRIVGTFADFLRTLPR